jgi:hypothetical protein
MAFDSIGGRDDYSVRGNGREGTGPNEYGGIYFTYTMFSGDGSQHQRG